MAKSDYITALERKVYTTVPDPVFVWLCRSEPFCLLPNDVLHLIRRVHYKWVPCFQYLWKNTNAEMLRFDGKLRKIMRLYGNSTVQSYILNCTEFSFVFAEESLHRKLDDDFHYLMRRGFIYDHGKDLSLPSARIAKRFTPNACHPLSGEMSLRYTVHSLHDLKDVDWDKTAMCTFILHSGANTRSLREVAGNEFVDALQYCMREIREGGGELSDYRILFWYL